MLLNNDWLIQIMKPVAKYLLLVLQSNVQYSLCGRVGWGLDAEEAQPRMTSLSVDWLSQIVCKGGPFICGIVR
jgi:hypothetical protein